MKNLSTILVVDKDGLKKVSKDFSFNDPEGAENAYNEAVQVVEFFTPYEGAYFVKKIGNVVRVPSWLPFVPSN